MKINELEKKIEELKQGGILPKEFTLKIVDYQGHDVKIAAGNVEDAIFRWDADGKGYIGYESIEDIFVNEDGEIQLGKTVQYRHYPSLNC